MYRRYKMLSGMNPYLAALPLAPYPIFGVLAGSAVLGRVAIGADGRVHGAWQPGQLPKGRAFRVL